MRRLAAGVAFAGLWAACTGTGEASPPATVRAAITSGRPDEGSLGVAALVGVTGLSCSATLISDRVLLTAAHCITAAGPTHAVFGASRMAPSRVIEVAGHRLHERFNPATLEHDIALLLLASPAEATPWPLWTRPLDESFVGRPIRLVGFGTTGARAGDAGTRREGDSTIASLSALTFRLAPTPSQTCDGDSGGPAFLVEDGVEYLVGVSSWGDPECAQTAVDTRVDIHVGRFILPYLIETSVGSAALGERCYRDENCLEGSCMDSGEPGAFSYCSKTCATSEECPGGMNCGGGEPAMCRHPHPGPGAPGATCASDADCGSGRCARSAPDASGVCSVRCFAENEPACAEGFTCLSDVAHPGTSACFTDAPEGGGCAATAGKGGSRGGIGPAVAAAALGLTLRARRRDRRTTRRTGPALVLLAALAAGGCDGGCRGKGTREPERPTPSAAAPVEEGGATVLLRPEAAWGSVQVERGGEPRSYRVVFELAPEAAIHLRLPEGFKPVLAPLPAPAPVPPLPGEAYTFELTGAPGKPTGFRFETRGEALPEPLRLTVSPAAQADALDVRLVVGSLDTGAQTLSGLRDCRLPPPGRGIAPSLPEVPRLDAAFTSLTRELTEHLPEFQSPEPLMRAVAYVLGRSLIDVDALARATNARPCGGASLEFTCEREACPVALEDVRRPLKAGDSLTIGLGTEVTFLDAQQTGPGQKER